MFPELLSKHQSAAGLGKTSVDNYTSKMLHMPFNLACHSLSLNFQICRTMLGPDRKDGGSQARYLKPPHYLVTISINTDMISESV